MKTYNVSDGHINFSQRNNKVNPYKSCNTTSMIMAASYIPSIWKALKASDIYKQYNKQFVQPEDCLQQYMLDNHMVPTQHTDLCKAFNQFIGYNVAKFSMGKSLLDLASEIKAGRPVVISGNFPKSDGRTLGHVVVLVGCIFKDEEKESRLPDKWIIDDPFGNTLLDWQGSGNDVQLSNEYFKEHIKNCGSMKKWAHTFVPLEL